MIVPVMNRRFFGNDLRPRCATLLSCLLLSLAPSASSAEIASAPVELKDDRYRAASYVVGCYSIGKAALDEEKGILGISMLVRGTTFREWINVYYDPEIISEDRIQQLLRERKCPSATLDRSEGKPLTAMNSRVGPGDVVQLRLVEAERAPIGKVELPKGWVLVGPTEGFTNASNETFFTVRVPANAEAGDKALKLIRNDGGEILETSVEVVRKIGG